MSSKYSTVFLVIVFILACAVLPCVVCLPRVIECDSLEEIPQIDRVTRKSRTIFTVWRSTEERPTAPDNTCLCLNSVINNKWEVTGFQFSIGPCEYDNNQQLCSIDQPVWKCDCPFQTFSGVCECYFWVKIAVKLKQFGRFIILPSDKTSLTTTACASLYVRSTF
ncbi:uncharacterized protein [Amphiura filiformis]|uniref:uncharacterized protein n=1 Tax=Amphiura filiformis TaxID=82378 RepID=UPI003B218993